MSNWSYLNSIRVKEGQYKSTDADGFNGIFPMRIPGESRPVLVIGAADKGWVHLAIGLVTNKGPAKVPPYGIVKIIRDMFFEDDQNVIQIFFAPNHPVQPQPGKAHLWFYRGQDFPMPPALIVGPIPDTNKEQNEETKTEAEPEPGKVVQINGNKPDSSEPEPDPNPDSDGSEPKQFPA